MTTKTPHLDTQDPQALLDLVVRQRDLYQSLGSLSEQQQRFIDAGDTAKLLMVLSRRQTILDDLRIIAESLRPFRESWDDVRASLEQDDRERLRGLLDETDELMRSIMARDRADGDRLQQARGRVSKQLGRNSMATQATRAYQGTSQRPPANLPSSSRFTDKQG
ncbi:MAG: flagellar export chaperone FlgN [Phycisphaeraceae bacterium]